MSEPIITPRIALQLYTIRSEMTGDVAAVLQRVADAGYEAVELAGYAGLSATELKQALDRAGLTAMGAHVPIQQFMDRFDQMIAELKILGCQYATIPFLPPDLRPRSGDEVRRLAETINGWAAKARVESIRVGYHNHDFEFGLIDNMTMLDLLIDWTDPALVGIELDVYWAVRAGADPVALIERLNGRIPLLHVKDLGAGGTPTDVPVGLGIIDWGTVLPAAARSGTAWYIVEQDNPVNPLPDVATSHDNLAGLLA